MPTPSENFQNWLQDKIDAKMQAVLIGLEDIGNNCLREMRDPEKRGYKDQTNNLRSSTGFVIVYNGQIVKSSGFAPTSSTNASGVTTQGDEGTKEGEALAKEVASTEAMEGLALILVAGMNYAVYVERMGLNVLDSAKLFASAEVKELINDLMK